MIAIQTKFLGATNTKGSRVKAFIHSNGFNITIPWDYSLSRDQVYFKAVKELIKKYNLSKYDWNVETMTYGEVKNGLIFTFPESIIS